MPAGLSSVLLAMAVQAAPSPSSVAGDLEALKAIRHSGLQPSAIVLAHRGGTMNALAIYEMPVQQDETPVWVMRRTYSTEASASAEIVSSRSCPQIYQLVLALERLPVPRPEIRGARATAPTGFSPAPPAMGPLHTHYGYWSRGWTSNSEPVELSLMHLGSGPLTPWMTEAEALLQDCGFTPTDAPDGEKG